MKRGMVLLIYCLFSCLSSPAFGAERIAEPARSWDNHYGLYFILVSGVWIVVTALLIFFSLKYRRKKEKQEDGAYIPGNTLLEIVWTIVPLIIVTLLGIQTWAVYKEFRNVPKGAYEVNVEGFQWGWNMTYPMEGIKTTNELRVPVNVPVKISLSSRDVLHAFFIPEYRVQEETIPGRTTYFWFRPTKVGEYRAYCTEFCGNSHSLMLAKVIVMEQDDFRSWVAKHKQAVASLSPLEKGKKLVEELGCLGCPSLTGEKSSGPTFKGIFGRETLLENGKKVIADREYLEHSIKSPTEAIVKGYPASMPPYNMTEEDVYAMVDYLETLK
jgi:cytochrome c oxidase subunit 2